MQDRDTQHASPSVLGKRVPKSEKRLAFAVALKNGATIVEASQAAGINRNTGSVWAREIRDRMDVDSHRETIASKAAVAETLSQLVSSPDTAPPYKVQAAAGLARLMGYDAPTRSQVEVRTVPASVSAWLDTIDADAIDVTPERDAIETNARPALTHNETPARLNAPPATLGPPPPETV